jgi:hypothetical protein
MKSTKSRRLIFVLSFAACLAYIWTIYWEYWYSLKSGASSSTTHIVVTSVCFS